jgi:ketosteroid isomerase-like protein
MSFDPMAAAVDWLDAYRAGDIETLLDMYADDVMVHCGCGGMKTLAGREALRAYWLDRLQKYRALDLADLQLSPEGPTISYLTTTGVVRAVLVFDPVGKIKILQCGPSP